MVELHEISEEASSSRGYDVFLSFRGVDTRYNFTNHLHKALMHANITTFLDDEEIETGEDLKPELKNAIKSSKAFVIVLSKNYAFSQWCLDELVLILEQHKKSNHIVIPIFYRVEPTHVRKKQGSFGDAMSKYRQMMDGETDLNKRSLWAQKMDIWNEALTKVANLKGKDANGRLEVELIDEVVNDIFRRLRISSRFPLPQLIGMDDSIKFITSWLKDASSHTIDILTICGLGGMGKTSLAKYVYVLHFQEFDTSSFIEDITGRCDEKYNGMLDVQKQLYDEISKTTSVQVRDGSMYTSMIEKAIAHKKVFLVLDGIGTLNQLNVLLGSKGFHPGTKIIITTKDKCLTTRCALFKTNVKPKHEAYMVKGLSEIDSQELLCFHAFMCNNPMVGYEEVTKKLLKYCDGHPMALKVLGRSLHNRDVIYWEGYIDKLKKENDSQINNVLRMSFDSLPFKIDKDLFKHIACFFVGMDKDVAETILKACDIDTRTGITNLIDKCLLSYRWNNDFMSIELAMHQLVQEMGRSLARDESCDKQSEKSRLCNEESFKVLKEKMGTENVIGLTLDMRMLEKKMLRGSCELETNALSTMDRLMLLQLNYVQMTGSYKNFPKELRWLCMHGFPLKSIPSDLPMQNLVALDMSYSKIETFGISYSHLQHIRKRIKLLIGSCSKDESLFGSLKILNLSFCSQLRSLGGFGHLPKLERLILTGCIGLIEVCESIGHCAELAFIDMSFCNKLENLPRSIHMLKKVKTLLLKANNIGIRTKMSSSAILKVIPNDLKSFMIPLPRSLVTLRLDNNNLSTESFPMDFSCLFMLKELYLDDNPIVSLPNCVRSLPRIETLSLVKCNMLTSFENPPHTLKFVQIYIDSDDPMLRQIAYDRKMCHFQLVINDSLLASSSFEYEGIIKIQPLAGVDENILSSLGWLNLDFISGRRVVTFMNRRGESEIQMYYEFGIFSTIYEGEVMPNWITHKSTGPSISFTIPSSPNKFTGMNFCYVEMHQFLNDDDEFHTLPLIIISNIAKKRTWIYRHYIHRVGENYYTLLSHWMFGINEMECGDHVIISIGYKVAYGECGAVIVQTSGDAYCISVDYAVTVKECGVSFVYDHDGEEEDALGYYKSFDNIIGKDLTPYEVAAGAYFLNINQITQPYVCRNQRKCDNLCGEDAQL